MEVMEDGNLMDKVHILIQRDMEYYKNKQTVLQETICPGIIGGRLDFPRSASFAATKLVLWWEEEYIAAYRKPSGFLQKTKEPSLKDDVEITGGCGGIVKASDPAKFVTLISKSADQLLEHLHVLTQEALDHADLTVLTGTIGAAALLKNCLWFYIQSINKSDENKVANTAEQLQKGYKKYHEMCEALAERLLDLHCRLLSLYILQDAECLDWESTKAFSESERGSYIIQMWWLYMQGTKEDLWNTVPPKMAQRVFAGMLNESLTILTVRYTQIIPSEARSQLVIVDISNLLLCVAQLLPTICDTAEELVGINLNNTNKILRDIHVKCQDLLICFLFRGAPLDILHKLFKNDLDNVEVFKTKNVAPMLWIIFALPHIFKDEFEKYSRNVDDYYNSEVLLALELTVLLAQPQPNWSILLKVLCMKNCKILKLIQNLSMKQMKSELLQKATIKNEQCGSFLCCGDGSCKNVNVTTKILNNSHYYDLIYSTTNVLFSIANTDELKSLFLSAIEKTENWAQCFERRHVWNQIRPAWYEAILNLVAPLLNIITETVINAIQTEASMYQAMSLILACFSQFWHCTDPALAKIAALLQEDIPADIVPLNNSVLIEILVAALYTNLLNRSEKDTLKNVKFNDQKTDNDRLSVANLETVESISLAISESLCSIDEDNKHTDQIEEFLQQIRNDHLINADYNVGGSKRVESNPLMADILVSDLLMTQHGKKSLKVLYHFIKCNSEWFFQQLGFSEEGLEVLPNKAIRSSNSLLHTMFHIGYRPFDQLLSGDWKPNWLSIMQIPMGLNVERVWMQISLRWEFRDINTTSLTPQDIKIINFIMTLLKS